jgi:methionyl-tRNA formyltransferase
MNQISQIKFGFFGSSRFSIIVLDELKKTGLEPSFIVTTPDKPQGRKLKLTPNVVKSWAITNNIRVYDFAKLDKPAVDSLAKENANAFIVASYGKILPSSIIDLPTRKTLNIHPSLLPRYRGPSPLQQAMLDDSKQTAVTIIRIDEQMDHGPIVAQKEITVNKWPTYEDFEEMMASEGARLLSETLPEWIAGTLTEKPQDHSAATYTKKFKKEDGLLDLDGDPYTNFRKIQAFHEWPQAYFFIEHADRKIRVKITEAGFTDGKLIIKKVVPEGSVEMSYDDFRKGYGFK